MSHIFTHEIFERDRPRRWNIVGLLVPQSKYGIGNEWQHFETDDGTLRCERCGYCGPDRAVMIVNDPFDPEEPVDFDSPTQVHCETCIKIVLPNDSPYSSNPVKSGSATDLNPNDISGVES